MAWIVAIVTVGDGDDFNNEPITPIPKFPLFWRLQSSIRLANNFKAAVLWHDSSTILTIKMDAAKHYRLIYQKQSVENLESTKVPVSEQQTPDCLSFGTFPFSFLHWFQRFDKKLSI